ncbi:MAG: hypothetical protein GY839_04040 [candidate division Zixibacteria bacterium]|nr:hypothetical protein [candidate division Zixibacteria bacterium]
MSLIAERVNIVAAAIIIILTVCPAALGQSDEKSFETMGLSVSLTGNINENQFHQFWEKAAGLEINSEVDFYKGKIQFGLNASEFSSKDQDIPGFIALYTYLGWGMEIKFPDKFNWFNSIQAGVFYMKFDDEEPVEDWRSENEIGIGLFSRLRYNVKGNWHMSLFARYLKVYTHKRIYHGYIGSGISYQFATPGWLKDFLR